MELLQETSLKEKLPRNQIETIAKSVLLKRNFPLPNLQVNNVLHHCASEFFSLLVAEIMDISKEKDVTNESVVNALKVFYKLLMCLNLQNLGFPQYIEGVQTSIEQANLLAKV